MKMTFIDWVVIAIVGTFQVLIGIILLPISFIGLLAKSKIFFVLANIIFYFLIFSFFNSSAYQAPVANLVIIGFLILYWIDLAALGSYSFHYYVGRRLLWTILLLINILLFAISIPTGVWWILLFMTPFMYAIYELAFNTDGYHELLCFMGTGYPRNLKIEDPVWKPFVNKFLKQRKFSAPRAAIKF